MRDIGVDEIIAFKQQRLTQAHRDGKKRWEKSYSADETWTWRVFGPDGRLAATSTWNGKDLIDAKF